MHSLHSAAGFAGILFSLLQTTCALPTSDPTSAPSALVPRALDKYVDCSDDQEKVLGQGFADAATLARWTFDHPIDLSHTAYTHYLRPADAQLAKNVWDLIQQNNDPTNAQFHFTVRCSGGGAECPKGSLAITDATPRALPAVAQMLVCPLFFTSAETAKNLTSKTYKTNPGRRDPPSWCSPGQKFSDFETAGHTLLHEMTHIDALGAAAGLSERGALKSHGTDDVSGLSNNYQTAALQLKKLWDDGKQPAGAITPVENAENLAASATEWYFSNRCGFHEITS